MQFFSHQFGPGTSSQSWDAPETSSPSSDSIMASRSLSDEEVILASDRPKRSAGRKKFRETRHPVYRGVRKRNNDKWVCEVREPNKKSRIWLGTYETAKMAARAHDVATLALRGRSACLNFADSIRLPLPRSTEAKDIRKAARDAAELFRHETDETSTIENAPPLNDDQNGSCLDEEAEFGMPYLDDEAEFGMPGLLASMAEAMLLDPPPNAASDYNWSEEENGSEISLWSFSV